MATTRVERVRYYDGEYLRSADFQAEQRYHTEMRRRLNLALHLYGVVEGLTLEEQEDSVPGAPLFVLKEGLAVDQAGREIVVGSPYVLTQEAVLDRQGIDSGSYQCWLCYVEAPGGLPAAGYALCNDPDQQTRIREGFDVVLVPIPKPVTGQATVNPDGAGRGVRLGTVTVENDPAGGLRVGQVKNERRTYVGIRAQRLVPPDATPDAFDVKKKNTDAAGGPLPGYVDVRAATYVRRPLVAADNAVVGPDFEIKDADAVSPLPDMTKPGNLKVTNNLVLNGGLVANVAGKWYGLADYIKTLLPEFKTGSATIAVDVANTPPAALPVSATTLPFVSRAEVIVSLNGIVSAGKTDLTTWWSTLVGGTDLETKVAGVIARQGGSPNTFDLKLSYSVVPKDNPAIPANARVAVKQLLVNYLVVFFP